MLKRPCAPELAYLERSMFFFWYIYIFFLYIYNINEIYIYIYIYIDIYIYIYNIHISGGGESPKKKDQTPFGPATYCLLRPCLPQPSVERGFGLGLSRPTSGTRRHHRMGTDPVCSCRLPWIIGSGP